jgi:hypothetical protein
MAAADIVGGTEAGPDFPEDVSQGIPNLRVRTSVADINSTNMATIAIASSSEDTRTIFTMMATTMTTMATAAGGADGIIVGCVQITDRVAQLPRRYRSLRHGPRGIRRGGLFRPSSQAIVFIGR